MLRPAIFSISTLVTILLFSACKKDVGFNRPPIIDKVTLENRPGGAIYAQVNASDPDGDPIIFTYSHASKRVVLEADEDEVLIKNLPELGAGSLTITVKDDRGGVSTKTISLKADNQPPAIAVFGSDKRAASLNESVKLTVLATDIEQDSLTYSFSTDADGVSFSTPKAKTGGFVESIMTFTLPRKDSVEVIASVTDNIGGEATTNLFVTRRGTLTIIDSISVPQAYSMAYGKGKNDLYVSNIADKIYKVDLATKQATLFATVTGLALNQGQGIRALGVDTLSQNESVFVGIQSSSVTPKFDHIGNRNGNWLPSNWGGVAHYITPFINGIYLVANEQTSTIEQYTIDGQKVSEWGANSGNNASFNHVRQIYPDFHNHVIYVADRDNNSIKVLSYNGNQLQSWRNGYNQPHGVAYDYLRNVVYVSDTRNSRFKIFSTDGVLLRQVSIPQYYTEPRYILIDKRGLVYVAYTYESKVLVLDWQ